jgi:hypothetical protein
MEHTEPIFKELNILDIFKINDYLTAMFIFRYHHLKNLPEEFDNFFVSSNQIHQHNINTRNASKLYKQYKRTKYAKHTLSNKGADVWNLLESNIKDINSCTAFKKQVKTALFTELEIGFKFKIMHSTYILYSDKY